MNIGQQINRFVSNHRKYKLEGMTQKFFGEEIACVGRTIIKPKTPFQFIPERVDILDIRAKDGQNIAKVIKSNKKGENYFIQNAEDRYFNKLFEQISKNPNNFTAEQLFNNVFEQIKSIAKEAFSKF